MPRCELLRYGLWDAGRPVEAISAVIGDLLDKRLSAEP